MSDTLRWGILGTAEISTAVIPAIQAARGATVAAVASRTEARARAWAERYGIPHVFGSYEALLGSGLVDVVYLPLPNALHAEWTLRALAAGLPVLCEKPLAPTAAEARAVAAASREAGLPVMEAFMYGFHPQWRLARRLLEDGAIGALRSVEGSFSFFLDERDGIVASAALAGGALLDVGCYPVHAMRQIVGEEPTRVSAFARFDGVDDTMVGLLDFPGGVLGRFETSIATAEQHGFVLCGTEARLVLPDPWVPEPGAARVLLRRHGQPDEVHVPEPSDTNAYVAEIEHFGEVVRGRVAYASSLEDSVANAVVLENLARSAREGVVIAA